jgi:1,2-diacylglycerol 3-beta-galactosyltransferase
MVQRISTASPVASLVDTYSKVTREGIVRRRIESYNPDAIVSVHPTMNSVPLLSTKKLSKAQGKHIPFFTVVDGFETTQTSWFQRSVDKIYVASNNIQLQAKQTGHVPDENIVKTGIPIGEEFDVHAQTFGDRWTPMAKQHQQSIRKQLGLDPSKPMVLVMGDCEKVNGVQTVLEELHRLFTAKEIDATVCVICGQNEKYQRELTAMNWDDVIVPIDQPSTKKGLFSGRFLTSTDGQSLDKATTSDTTDRSTKGDVTVIALGSVSRMVDYMIAADVMVTSANPVTIAEAATLGLPLMLTRYDHHVFPILPACFIASAHTIILFCSFLPGPDATAENAEFVIDSRFGWYEKKPIAAAKEVTAWFENTALLDDMSQAARRAAYPYAAAEITMDIGMITQTWIQLNDQAPINTSA